MGTATLCLADHKAYEDQSREFLGACYAATGGPAGRPEAAESPI
jgi:hypothetical protein